jgi:hypothetical protein|tara:strand:- start:160 stop:510 length:351 start_codon:yes stop_codon:yes gene_type:complete
MEGNFFLKKKIKEKGFYINVKLNICTLKGEGVEIINPHFNKETDIVFFAIKYFLGIHKKFFFDKKVVVEIIDMRTMIVDTTPIIILYGILKAMENATNLSINELKIDDEGNIIFPK